MEDISLSGAGFKLKRPVKRGRLLQVSVPIPRQLRAYDFLEPQYHVWGLIRRCVPAGTNSATDEYAVGVAFIGKTPPATFIQNPAKLYDLESQTETGLWKIEAADLDPDESDLPKYLRRHSRFSIPEALLIEMLDEHGDVIANEVSVTENISISGAAVFTSLNVDPGSFLRVKSEANGLSIISIVRGKRIGPDGIVRLHIEFVDHLYPLGGVE